ncbi:MAG TPA: type II secretion system protein [Candidatus Moranbacteria bacterium]|nr:type II secretion system protein [Candidatus Moranbacteria bacterium]
MKRKNKKGTSLVELLIYISIMGIMTAAIVSFIASNKKVGDRNEAISEVETQGNEIVEIISQTIRNSSTITGLALGASANQLTVVDNAVTIVFSLSSGKVTIKRGGASAVDLNTNQVVISNLSFKNFGNATKGSINFQFDADYLNSGNRAELNYAKTFSGSASLR